MGLRDRLSEEDLRAAERRYAVTKVANVLATNWRKPYKYGKPLGRQLMLAEALAAAGLLAERRAARIWREGFDAGAASEWGVDDDEIYPPNPYDEKGRS